MMKLPLFACLWLVTIAPVFAQQAVLAPAETDGMKKLFNGKDLWGWDGDTGLWTVRDGCLHGETTEAIHEQGTTLIIWKDVTV